MDQVIVSAVSYLNTRPFISGLLQSPVYNSIQLNLESPSECARKLITGKSDIGLVPVIALREIPSAQIISNYCIGANGEVGSVLLASQVPSWEISEILLDNESRTSAELVKIIAEKLWHLNPSYSKALPGYEQDIRGHTAGLIIGDRAIRLKAQYNYVYDLSLLWLELTGLPFVFACWVCNKKLPLSFLDSFEEALKKGVSSIDSILKQEPGILLSFPGARVYLKEKISYLFDEEKKKGMDLFLSMVNRPESSTVG